MLSAGLSLLAFAIIVVGGCWWLERGGVRASASPPTDSEDQASLAAIALVVTLSETSSCTSLSDPSSHGACSDHF